MPTPAHPSSPRPALTACDSLRPAVILVLVVLAARIIYLLALCPYDLVEDEAHYWLWSRFPDWSYYSKGPGVAWVIWLATRILGDAEWAVRLPAAFAGAVGALAAAGLARDVCAAAWSRRAAHDSAHWASPSRVALMTAAVFTLVPALQMTGFLMTIDGPYLACWAVAAWAAWRAFECSSRRAWIVLGAAFAAGFLFKYTMLLLLPGLLHYAWVRRARLSLAPRAAPWIIAGLLIAALGLLPVLIWNAQQGWPTVRHLLGHLGVQGGDVPVSSGPGFFQRWKPWWSLELIGQQVGMIGPALIIAVIAAVKSWRRFRLSTPGAPADPRLPGRAFLACAAAPILLFYLAVSLVTEPEGNWPLGAYVTLIPLGAWWMADMLAVRRDAVSRGLRPPAGSRGWWHATLAYGLIAAPFLHRADLAAAAVNRLNQTQTFRAAFTALAGREPRPIIPGRLIGGKAMAAHVRRLLDQLHAQTGLTPFVLSEHYGRASQLSYYLRSPGGRPAPDILSAMSQTGGRKSQFDIWPHTSLDRPDLRARPAVVLSSDWDHLLHIWQSMFDHVDLLPTGKLDGEHRPDRVAYLAFGYRGLPRANNPGPPAPADTDPHP